MNESWLFAEIERVAGPLTPLQRILLGTDGSVTRILELATGAPVTITTLSQTVEAASPPVAEMLAVPLGQEVNHRIVELKNTRTGETLIYAESYTPLSRLSPSFREDLMRADTPIGRILEQHHLETRREIVKMTAGQRPAPVAASFGLSGTPRFLSREYRIIHQEHPLIHIEEIFPAALFSGETMVVIDAPSRLHLGLLDMNGALGRIDGGMGLALDEPRLVVSARRSDTFLAEGGDADARERVLAAAASVSGSLNLPGAAEFTIQAQFPGHAGLGRGTQLALSAACALCRLYGQEWTARDLARMTGRGGTSGIGTASFGAGGFIIDGGHSFGANLDKTAFLPSSASRGVRPPEVILRRDFPEAWKILLVIPDIPPWASGGAERDLFLRYCPVPLEEVRELCHLAMVSLLPGLAEEDLDLFGSAINRMQELGFKRVENQLQPSRVADLMVAMRNAGAAGAGLSSFGPAVYAIGEGRMHDVESAAREIIPSLGGGRVLLTRARNSGAVVTVA